MSGFRCSCIVLKEAQPSQKRCKKTETVFNMDRDLGYSIDIFQIFCKPEAHLKRAVNRNRPKVRYEIRCTKVLGRVSIIVRAGVAKLP